MNNSSGRYWWLGFVVSAILFVSSLVIKNYVDAWWSPAAAMLFKYLTIPLILASILAYFRGRKGRELLASQTGLDSIRALSWKKFEDLITEAYRQNGYRIKRGPVAGSDGGVDIMVEKDGGVTLVQCKQWRLRKLGVKVVREMFGILSSSNADDVHIVTTGRVTNEAQSFAKGKPIKIVYGRELLNLISEAQKNTVNNKNNIEPATLCPECGSEMVLRKARKGMNAGNEFWGCVQFPKCRGTVDVSG